MIETDLFEFAYVPDWYGQLEQLAEMALPEAWRFRKPQTECKNTDTPILERYLHMMFRKMSIDYNTGETAYFHVENNCACFHTGLYTRQYQAIYACFERNKKKDTTLKWYFTGFCDAVSSKLRYVEPLPKKPYFPMMQNGVNFNPEWPIRVNAEHILSDPENRERLPKKLLRFKNLPLLLETAVELGRKIMQDILDTTKIPAACGVGTNLYLAKVALDIMAKHETDRIAYLDEARYREKLWKHKPLTDFWRVGRGTVERLSNMGICTMEEIAHARESLLYKAFGIDAELLIDHAWGREPVTIADIKAYRPKNTSLSSGQVLPRDYSYEEGILVVKEMADLLCLDLVDQGLVTSHISLVIGYSNQKCFEPAKGSTTLRSATAGCCLM